MSKPKAYQVDVKTSCTVSVEVKAPSPEAALAFAKTLAKSGDLDELNDEVLAYDWTTATVEQMDDDLVEFVDLDTIMSPAEIAELVQS